MKEPGRILIVRTDRIGDVILSTPVIENVRRAFPRAYIAFMCRPYTKDVLEGNPYLDEVIIYDKYNKHKNFWRSVKFTFYLRRKKFDWAFVLHPTNRAHLITFFAAIPFRVGWDRKMGNLLTKKFPHLKQMGRKHELEYTLDILRALNIPLHTKRTYFPLSKEAGERVERLLMSAGMGKEDAYIVIHPSASCPSKRWPESYFSRLIALLKEKLSLRMVVITSKEEAEFAETVIRDNDAVDLRGKLTIPEVGGLLKKAALFISNDSGPVHIAAALNTPVISIFGRNDAGLSPARWRPQGENSFYFHGDAGCKTCFAHNCRKGFACLKAIKPEDVAEKAVCICQHALAKKSRKS